jgi:glycosyltransferase involved in cell wall biosynthesis
MTAVAPTVSVLMPVFNRARYVRDAIESVLVQRFTDFELVVVDDGSTDDTRTVVRDYVARDARVRLEENGTNLGQFENRNRAVDHARGRYLKFHDSDDLMYPHCLETMVSLLDAEPRAGFALSTAWAWPGGPVPMLSTPRQSYEREFMGFGLFMCGPACGLYRREVFEALGGWPTEGVHSDTLFLMRALARYPVLLLPADLFWYRIHPGQELSSGRAAHDYARLPGAVWHMLASEDCPLDENQRRLARRAHAWSVAKHTWRDVRAGRYALAAYRLRHGGMSLGDWLRYFGRPNRSAAAGVTRTPDGEWMTPDWVRLPRQSPDS